MNDLDKKDLLELANIIKTHANKIDSLSIDDHIVIDGISNINAISRYTRCVYVVIYDKYGVFLGVYG